MTQFGRVEWVATEDARAFLTAAAAISDTVLEVDNGNIFEVSPVPGSLTLPDGTVVTYSAWDDETVTLDDPLLAAFDEGDAVAVSPARSVKYAGVNLAPDTEWSETIKCRVPYGSQWFSRLADGVYDDDERPVVEIDLTLEPVLVDLVNEQAEFDGGYIDPDSTIPTTALTDGEPPASSPTPTVGAFAVGGLRWAVTPVANADPVRFRVYADTVDPPTQDAAHLVADTGSLSGTFSSIDGVRLLPDDPELAPDPIYVAVVEYDADGEAAMGASSDPATPRRADNTDISADYGYFGQIEANQIAAGSIFTQLLMLGDRIEFDGPNSTITIYDSADPLTREALVQLRPDGSVFRGQVIADDISVLNGMILQGLLSHISQNAGLTIDNSVANPATGPTLSVTPQASSWAALHTDYTARGFCWDGTNWLRLSRKSGSTNTRIETINTSGVRTDSVLLDNMETSLNAAGIVKVGAYWFIMARVESFDEATDWRIYRFNTSGVRVAFSSRVFTTDGNARPAIGTDGTNLLIAAGYDETVVEVFDPDTLTDTGTEYIVDEGASPLWDGTGGNLTYVGKGSFDFGSDHVVIGSGYDAHVFTISGTDLIRDDDLSFTTIDSQLYGGLTWNGSNFYSSRTYLNKYNDYYPGASENAYVAHRDNNGSDHTKVSPITSAVLKKRWYVSATFAPAPSGATTPSVWMKLATSTPAATALLARTDTITGRTVLLDPSVAGGSALTTDTNTFGTGTAGWIKSQAGGFEVYGDGDVKAPGLQVYSTRYTRVTNQSLTSGAVTVITFTANDGTAPANAGLSESSGSVTVSQAGVYRVTGMVAYANASDATRRNAFLYVGGSARIRQEIAATNGAPTYVQVVDDIPLNASDIVTLRGRHNATGSINVTEASLTLTRIGDLAP